VRKFSIILLTAVVVLGTAALVIACEGAFVDPGHNDVYGLGNGGGAGGAGGKGGKPAMLSEDATLDEAIAKLDEIIDYPKTPPAMIPAARNTRDMLDRMTPATWNNYPFNSRLSIIDSINAMIDII
jgi:hypothetical protein